MTKTTLVSLCLFLLLPAAAFAQAPATPVDTAVEEGVRREHKKIQLGQKLAEAQAAQKKGDLVAAAQAYEESLKLIKEIGAGTGIEAQEKLVMDGFVSVRLMLAEQAVRAGDFENADRQVARVLKEYPKTAEAEVWKKKIDQTRLVEDGRRPADDIIAKLPDIRTNAVRAATHVQNGKLLFEAGKLDEAEWELIQARRLDPGNKAADHYLNLIIDQQHKNETVTREEWSKHRMLEVDKAWNQKIKRDTLPVPNPYARTNLVHTSKGRQIIYSKLDRIKLNELSLDSIPLGDVVTQLSVEAKNRDPDKRGINFIVNANVDPAVSGPPPVDPGTGLPIPQAVGEAVDISGITIRLKPALTDITLHQALDAIQKVADRPIKYSIEDYAVVFSLRTPESPPLHSRTFKVDPNTFLQGLQGVIALDFGTGSGGQGGGGGGGFGGGGGGGGRGGGGGGRGGGGRGGGNQGGGGQGNQGGQGSGGGSEYVGVSLAGGGQGGRRGQQAGAGGQPGGRAAGGAGGAAGQGQGGGIRNLTQETETLEVIDAVRAFFLAAGVDLAAPKALFFNERQGSLLVRATLQDLDTIEQAIQVLNMSPPQVTIETKFAEVTQDDNRALGFDWYWGNTLMDGGRLGVQGGTAPSFGFGVPEAASRANPSGVFPGPGLIPGTAGPGAIPPSVSDNIVTGGLRNSAPAVATFTGILTDPQFRVVIRALEQRQGVDLLSAPKITTLSSRQAQIKVVDVRYIVTDLDLTQNAGGTGGGAAGSTTISSAVGSTIQPLAEPFELGPVLDVVPYVSADGYTVQMTIIPTIKEFIGYDLETARLFSAQAQSVGQGVAGTLSQTTPLPIFRLRQVVTSAVVWDGQTVVLGGLISENVMKTKDKVPVMGDLPLIGRFFRSESSMTKKKNLLIFVTPTIIDPAGNRMHSEEELPFSQNAIPPQVPVNK